MATDETHAGQLRRAVAGCGPITEKKMFGGICFMLRGHMLCAVSSRGLLFRVGAANEAAALARPGARTMEMRGRRMHGYVRVDPAACRERDLADWVALAADCVAALPAKSATRGVKQAPRASRAKARGALRSARRSRNRPAG
jgi:TfoX/Sxy family transcriptional regulator of competence genes